MRRRRWLSPVAAAIVALYLLGPQPHVQWSSGPAPAVGVAYPERHRVAFYLAGIQTRLFDISFSTNDWNGFGIGAAYKEF